MKHDLAILGGGLAGLALARQLALEVPDLDVVVLDAGRHPVPEAAFKVGESSVEIGAGYLADTLGLRAHLDERHLKKFGLRCFFGSGGDIARADELGASSPLPVSAWQMDRGRLENHLHACVLADGVTVIEGAEVGAVEFDPCGSATVRYRRHGERHALTAARVVDASGRRGLLRKRFALTRRSSLDGNAAWFRIDERIRIDDWSDDADWQARVPGNKRWLSTNHLMGEGCWVWLIPLASGSTSVGIVADAHRHPLRELHTHERALQWLARHQPQCRERIGGQAMDFHRFRSYSYSSARVFSTRRDPGNWALVGEAGQFVDPFYSPGLDFIAYANTFVTDLVRRERAGEDVRSRRLSHEHSLAAIHASTLALYEGQYAGFGHFGLMTMKTVWDYAYYWSVLGFLHANAAFTDTALLAHHGQALAGARARHRDVQAAFRDAAARSPTLPPAGRFADHAAMPLMRELNASLAMPVTDPDRLGAAFAARLSRLDELAQRMLPRFPAAVRGLEGAGLPELVAEAA